MGIFQNSVLRNTKQDESILAHRWASFQDYLAKTEAIKDFKEEIYQDGFLHDVFEKCLGYTLKTTNPNNYSLDREQKNETDSKKADGAIYIDGKVVGVIELKDQKSKNLDAIEAQAFGYHASHANSRYIIISNFDELRFYIDKKSYYEKFNLFNLDFDEFRKLHLILSFESISSGLTNRLLEQSNRFEVDISKKLYSDFSDFRTHLFENIVKNNYECVSVSVGEGVSENAQTQTQTHTLLDKQTLLRLTQKLCDRLIFILFAEDRGLLRPNTIKEIRQEFANQKFTSYTLYDIYKFYFDAISNGNKRLDIQKYNGGLFAKDELLDSLVIDDDRIDLEAQKLSDYDFMSDIGVNILGHIFEQSLSDIEELNASINDIEFDRKKSKRKKDGVFYTPEYITRYIVENTLGKLCTDKKAELDIIQIEPPKDSRKPTKKEQATKANLEIYRNWLLELKIIDPACGSGAFLNQALEFLIREHKSLQQNLVIMGDITAFYDIEESILEHNLYGVDINEDAVEIARLSLWLRTAQKGRMLTNLSDKIVCANSLLEMPFDKNSFDVVIGNPPYVRQEAIKDQKEALSQIYEVYTGTADLYVYFYELAIRLLKPNGLTGFICSNKFFRAKYGENLRRYILDNTSIEEIADFNGVKIFE
ncbi:MAG: N-6 DNA methylase, partial [Epsilonproteobacteria bacterium]|nr:N-6 DNA methylase [Campylobacterota bacterium]